MDRTKQIELFARAMLAQGVHLPQDMADRVLTTIEIVAKVGKQFSLAHAESIDLQIQKRYGQSNQPPELEVADLDATQPADAKQPEPAEPEPKPSRTSQITAEPDEAK